VCSYWRDFWKLLSRISLKTWSSYFFTRIHYTLLHSRINNSFWNTGRQMLDCRKHKTSQRLLANNNTVWFVVCRVLQWTIVDDRGFTMAGFSDFSASSFKELDLLAVNDGWRRTRDQHDASWKVRHDRHFDNAVRLNLINPLNLVHIVKGTRHLCSLLN